MADRPAHRCRAWYRTRPLQRILAEAAADPLPPAGLGHHITGMGHMGAKAEGIGLEVVGAHYSPCRIDRHPHRLGLVHPQGAGLRFGDRRVVGEGFASAKDRLQQRPDRWPVGWFQGADLQRG